MAKADFPCFQPSLMFFLDELSRNNTRPWFQENKHRFEQDVQQPCLEFIRAFAPRLRKISPHFVASDRKVGGSLMRIYKDIRFSKDKRPYKTNVGMHFRHELGKDVHAPGFYIHLAPDECFLGVGLWCPGSEPLGRIREAIVNHTAQWKRARDNAKFRAEYDLSRTESLKTAPRGYDKNHPLIDDLRLTSFTGMHAIEDDDVFGPSFIDRVQKSFAASKPFMKFLCDALGVPI
mgnify:CR=1 FL=1